jgi:RNA methyltransferase, TrmH family
LAADHLSSPHNPLITTYIKLRENRRYRQKSGKIALEGPNLIREAMKAGLTAEAIFFTSHYSETDGKAWMSAIPASAKCYTLSESLFKRIADTDTPQPVAAIFSFDYLPQQHSLGQTPSIALILDRLQDPGNLGTIIRTAAAAGVDTVYYASGCADPYSPKALRSSAGAVFSIRVEYVDCLGVFVQDLKKSGVQLIASSPHSTISYRSVQYKPPLALLVGNEASGLSDEMLKAADLKVSIPLKGEVESLNASVAAAVLLFEIIHHFD